MSYVVLGDPNCPVETTVGVPSMAQAKKWINWFRTFPNGNRARIMSYREAKTLDLVKYL